MNADTTRFASLAQLQEQHYILLERQDAECEKLAYWDEVRDFTTQAAATGALLEDRSERRAAQSLLDFWSAGLYRAKQAPFTGRLAGYDHERAPNLKKEGVRCPYQGLAAFSQSAAGVFFGRADVLDTMVTRLRAGQRLLIVVGASGSGKSSLVQAGLLPRLRQGAVEGTEAFRYAVIVPGADPLGNLSKATGAGLPAGGTGPIAPLVLVVDQFEELFTLCSDDVVRAGFVDALNTLMTAEARSIVILTIREDYKDKLVTFEALDAQFRKVDGARIDVGPLNMVELRSAIEGPANLVGMKFDPGVVDDLVAKVLPTPAGLPLLQFTLQRLWLEMPRNRVTREVYERVGDPLGALEHCADDFYKSLLQEDKDVMERVLLGMVHFGPGGEDTSARVPLDSTWSNAGDQQRVERVVRRLICDAGLLKLTGVDTDPCKTAAGAASPDLFAIAAESERGGVVAQVEVAHEALLRNWPTLRHLIQMRRDRLQRRQSLADAATLWQEREHNSGFLWSRVQLAEVPGLVEESDRELTDDERKFMEASEAALDEAERERQAIQERELRHAQELAAQQGLLAEEQRQRADEQEKTNRRLRAMALGLGLLVLALAIAIGVWIRKNIELAQLNQVSTARVLAFQSKIASGNRSSNEDLVLALAAAKKTPRYTVIGEAEQALHSALLRYLYGPNSDFAEPLNFDAYAGFAFNHDGLYAWRPFTSTVSEVGFDKYARQQGASFEWLSATQVPGRTAGSATGSAQSWIVQQEDAGQGLVLSPMSNPRLRYLIPGTSGPGIPYAFSTQGSLLVTGTATGQLTAWTLAFNGTDVSAEPVADAQDPYHLGVINSSRPGVSATALGFAKNGQKDDGWLVAGYGDGEVRIWGLDSKEPRSTIVAAGATSASAEQNAQTQSTGDSGEPDVFPNRAITAIAVAQEANVTPARLLVATGEPDGLIRLWHIDTRPAAGVAALEAYRESSFILREPEAGSGCVVTQLAFDPDSGSGLLGASIACPGGPVAAPDEKRYSVVVWHTDMEKLVEIGCTSLPSDDDSWRTLAKALERKYQLPELCQEAK